MIVSTDEIRRQMEQEKFTMYRITGYCPHCGVEFTHSVLAKTPVLNISTEWEEK